jgi:Ala-tRNA(Pro) deacylase
MPVLDLKQYLDSEHVGYRAIPHVRTFTARQTAGAAHLPNKDVAKTVLVLLDGRPALAVLPATKHIDLNRLCEVANAETASMAREKDLAVLFTDCELGAMPPLGNLYNLPVFVDESLADDEEVAFNAGTHTELIQIPFEEFVRVVHPVTGKFGLPM